MDELSEEMKEAVVKSVVEGNMGKQLMEGFSGGIQVHDSLISALREDVNAIGYQTAEVVTQTSTWKHDHLQQEAELQRVAQELAVQQQAMGGIHGGGHAHHPQQHFPPGMGSTDAPPGASRPAAYFMSTPQAAGPPAGANPDPWQKFLNRAGAGVHEARN